jgi:hypothetical protein
MKTLTPSFFAVLYLLTCSTVLQAQMKVSTNTISSKAQLQDDPISEAFTMRAPSPKGEAHGNLDVERNSVYVEIIGSGLVWSINYDNLVSNHVALRAGVGYLGLGTSSSGTNYQSVTASILTIPLTASYLFSSDGPPLSSHKFELGAGLTLVSISGSFSSFSTSGFGLIGTAILGYRYQPADGGVLFRADVTPWFGSGAFLIAGGLSIGYTF